MRKNTKETFIITVEKRDSQKRSPQFTTFELIVSFVVIVLVLEVRLEVLKGWVTASELEEYEKSTLRIIIYAAAAMFSGWVSQSLVPSKSSEAALKFALVFLILSGTLWVVMCLLTTFSFYEVKETCFMLINLTLLSVLGFNFGIIVNVKRKNENKQLL
ncbi:unnamed protein product [Clavelina lepadiformis]|uniref:Transmembrane protein n=1 Tax=Clavelina lepadiformis TaxID=159417 RepID=A0ABP0H090_CLALP